VSEFDRRRNKTIKEIDEESTRVHILYHLLWCKKPKVSTKLLEYFEGIKTGLDWCSDCGFDPFYLLIERIKRLLGEEEFKKLISKDQKERVLREER